MIEINNPATPPGTPGQVPGQAKEPANNTPAANPQGQPQGGNKEGQKIEMDAAEIERLKRDAGRWDAYQKNAREERRKNRHNSRTPEYQDLDGAAPEVLEALRSRDTKLDELSLANRELAVKDRIRDLFDSEEYKSVPAAVKKAIVRNPLGFVNRNSESIEDAVADIQDYLDDELDSSQAGGQAQPGGQPAQQPAPTETHQVPPIAGSGPASPNSAADAEITGKSGPARSTAILSNLLKNRK